MAQQNDTEDNLLNSQMEIDIKSVTVTKKDKVTLCELTFDVNVFVCNKHVGTMQKKKAFHPDIDSLVAVNNFFDAAMDMVKKDLNAGEWQNQ